MPTNKKEGIIFTVMMCSLMVIGMSIYNLWVHNSLNIIALAIGFIPGFIVAFVLDVFIVGVVAKKLAFKYDWKTIANNFKKLYESMLEKK